MILIYIITFISQKLICGSLTNYLVFSNPSVSIYVVISPFQVRQYVTISPLGDSCGCGPLTEF